MAPLITHLVIGERVFLQQQRFDLADYGPFLLGCILVDVHFCGPHLCDTHLCDTHLCGTIDRRRTHFAERLVKDSANGFNRSCANFLECLDGLLVRPWGKLTSAERAFVAGYLCHLAADEDWKQFDWDVLQTLGMRWWIELPVPVDVPAPVPEPAPVPAPVPVPLPLPVIVTVVPSSSSSPSSASPHAAAAAKTTASPRVAFQWRRPRQVRRIMRRAYRSQARARNDRDGGWRGESP